MLQVPPLVFASGWFDDDDDDGLSNWLETYAYPTNPNDPDSDDDSALDGQEVNEGYDPKNNNSYPPRFVMVKNRLEYDFYSWDDAAGYNKLTIKDMWGAMINNVYSGFDNPWDVRQFGGGYAWPGNVWNAGLLEGDAPLPNAPPSPPQIYSLASLPFSVNGKNLITGYAFGYVSTTTLEHASVCLQVAPAATQEIKRTVLRVTDWEASGYWMGSGLRDGPYKYQSFDAVTFTIPAASTAPPIPLNPVNSPAQKLLPSFYLNPTWGYSTYEEKVKVSLIPVDIGVDNNRDGTLALTSWEDKTTALKPYRFWLNSDDDRGWGDDTYIANRDNPWTPEVVDNLDDKINEVRDLEDFARIHLNVESLHIALTAGTMTLGLKWKTVQSGTPKIRLFKAVEADGGTKYLSDTAKAADQVSASTSAIGVVEGTTTLDLPVSFWTSTASSTTKHFLFEGVGEGKGELTVVFRQGNTIIGECGSVFLDLLDIRKMYEQWGINPSAVIPDPDVDVLGAISGVAAVSYQEPTHVFQPAWDENLTDKNYVICVHGWRKGGPAAANPAQFYKGRSDEITMFKRLWHRGFKGRYIGFIWPTYDVEVKTGGHHDDAASALQSKFTHSEYRAWKCGEAFKNMVNGLPAGYKKKVFAHSLGNVVVGSALEIGMTVDNYALLNAAISARCYHDASAQIDTPEHLALLDIYDMSDDPTAAVRALSYCGDAVTLGHARLESVGGKISNFYLPNDYALSGVGSWETIQLWLKPTGSYQWERLPFHHEVQWDPWGPVNRVISDPHEAMAMVNMSWRKAVGAAPVPAGAGGTGIDTNINMNGPGMLFDNEHEAVFKWQCAKTWEFYSKLWDELNLPGTIAP